MVIGIDLDGVLTDISGFYRFNGLPQGAELADASALFSSIVPSDKPSRKRMGKHPGMLLITG